MIVQLYNDYTVSEMDNFANKYPERYDILCKIVGEFELEVRGLFVGVSLPYKNDKGCASASVMKDSKIEVIDIRYF